MAASQSSYVSGPFLSSATWLPSRSGASLTRPRIPSKRAPRDATYSGTARSSCRTSRSCDKMDPPWVSVYGRLVWARQILLVFILWITERSCPSSSSPVTFVCSVIGVLLSGTSTSGEDEKDEDDIDYDVHQPAVGVHPVAHLGHGALGAPAKQQVREHRKRRYKYGCHDEGHRSQKRRVVLREVHPDRHKNDEVGREHRQQQQPGRERRPWPCVLQGAKPPGGFARLAAHVALDGQEDEQPDKQVLDDVADRSGMRGVAERDAVAQHGGESVSDGDAHTHGDHHARYEVGRELQGLVGGNEDDGRHDLRPRVHRDSEGNYGQAHSSCSSCSRFTL